MDSINTLAGYSHISVPRSQDAGNANRNDESRSIQPTTDTYTSDPLEVHVAKSKTNPFKEDIAADLIKKYDVRNMDRSQYTRLITDLRNAGILTSQEYSAAYGGAMPSAAGNVFWPQGHQTVDFIKLLQDCSRVCKEAASGGTGEPGAENNNRILTSTYSHLQEIFSKMGDLADSAQQISLTKEQQEIERLTELLKEDKVFCESTHRSFMYHPIGQKLARAMIMADKQIQAQIAENMGIRISQAINMLNSGDDFASGQILLQFHNALVYKAKGEGLTEAEQLLDSNLERVNFMAQSTFSERMETVKSKIDQALQEKNMCLDPSKSYSFSLDTSSFTFSVSGGTDEENSIIADVINSAQNLTAALSALYGHKKEDGQVLSEEYADKIERLIPAYNQWSQENYMQKRYGFGMDDIEYVGGYKIIGKNDSKITEQINRLGMDFITFGGGALLSTIDHMLNTQYGFGLHEVDFAEDGTLVGKTKEVNERIVQAGDSLYNDIKQPPKVAVPAFDKPVFTLESGQFSVLYE